MTPTEGFLAYLRFGEVLGEELGKGDARRSQRSLLVVC